MDPLAAWWRHTITITPFQGAGPYGDAFGDPYTAFAAISGQVQQVLDGDGIEQVSNTTVAMPREVGYIRPGSKVTLPATHGGRTARVIACRVADGGGQPTPDHVEVNLT